ncbi:unnamed protein product [Trichogramma brassicae]|uniref:SHSP domain-containing protein n=1 Tax=Trichogramma brassicae TaxID=86971 RepID=A0A6H5ITT7_9HYME|nr:unnamed protein product [Trichogramma brassicae]
MSLVPLLFSDWWEDLDRPHRILDQDFGLGLHPEQLVCPRRLELYVPRRSAHQPNYLRPWAELLRGADQGGVSTVEADKDKFQVTLDVQQFKPEEIDVKVVDRYVVIKAKHEEKRDEHGWISREFTRKYLIPEVELDRVASEISSDGVLTIQAPLKPRDKEEKKEQVRRIKIEYTGKPALKEQQTEEEKKQTEDDDEISITTEEPEVGSGSSSTTASSATTEKQQ